MLRLRGLPIAAALLAAACFIDRVGTVDTNVQYSVVIDRTTNEGLGGKISTVREQTFAELLWIRGAGETRARLAVDSVHFSRDGRASL